MNPQELQKKIDELEKKVSELENWKYQKQIQQISFPLDKSSINSITISGIKDIAKALQNAGYVIT